MTARLFIFLFYFRQHFSSLHFSQEMFCPFLKQLNKAQGVSLRYCYLVTNYGVESPHKSFLLLPVSHTGKDGIYGKKESVFHSAAKSCQNSILQFSCQCINNHSLEAAWFHAGNGTSPYVTSGSVYASHSNSAMTVV